MSASHTTTAASRDVRLVPGLGLVDVDAAALPAALAEKVEGELEIFASHMRHGLLSAAINVGLDVFAQLLQTGVTDVAGVKGKHARTAEPCVTAASSPSCPWAVA